MVLRPPRRAPLPAGADASATPMATPALTQSMRRHAHGRDGRLSAKRPGYGVSDLMHLLRRALGLKIVIDVRHFLVLMSTLCVGFAVAFSVAVDSKDPVTW